MRHDARSVALAVTASDRTIIVIKAAKGADTRLVAALGATDLRLCCAFALAGGGQFRALRKISRVRRADGGSGVGHDEIAVFDAQQIAQRAFGQGVGVAGADKVFVRLGQAHLNVQHVGLQQSATLQTLFRDDQVGLKELTAASAA